MNHDGRPGPGIILTCRDEDQRDELLEQIGQLMHEDEQMEHDRAFRGVVVQRTVTSNDGFGHVIFDHRDAR